MFEKDPRTFSPEYKNLSPEQRAMVKLEITLTNFFRQFDKSVTRWERMVYPALIVFGLLGLSGFYLITNVTSDMHTVAQNVDPRMESNLDAMAQHMAALSKNVAQMTGQIGILVTEIHAMQTNIAHMDGQVTQLTGSIDVVRGSVETMTAQVGGMAKAVDSMAGNVAELNQSTRVITANMGSMSRDMRVMNDNVSRPMNFMNSFSPW